MWRDSNGYRLRATDPAAIGRAWQHRTTRSTVRGQRQVDDPSPPSPCPRCDRGGLAAERDMNSRTDLLDGCEPRSPTRRGPACWLLGHLDDLVLLGALEDKVVFSSMNRGGWPGHSSSLDDRDRSHRRGNAAAR